MDAALMETVPGAGYMAQTSKKGWCFLHPSALPVSSGNAFCLSTSKRVVPFLAA